MNACFMIDRRSKKNPFSLDQTSFTCADKGPNSVVLTVTDMAGFFLVLSLATLFMPYLVPS